LEIRNYVKKKLQYAAVSKIVIERAWNSIRVTIFTARPGIVIGRKGAEIEKMTEEISKMAQGKQVKIDIQEIKTPELVPKEFVSVLPDASMVRKFRGRSGIAKVKFPCTRCGLRSIMALPRLTPFTARLGSNVGSARRRRRRLSLLLRHHHRLRRPNLLKSKEKIYAVDAKTREVSKVPAGKPQGDCFAQSQN
jgi:KH domain